MLFHAKKQDPQEQRFPLLLLGKNRTTGAENRVRRAVSREKKTCPSAALIQKQTLQEKEHFFQWGEKFVLVELTRRLRRGEEKVSQCFLTKNRPTGREISAPPETLSSHLDILPLHFFQVQTFKRKKFKHSHSQTFSPHIGTARNLQRFSQHFQIFNSQIFSSSRLLSHTIISFYVFKLLLNLNYSFFPKTLEQEGIRRSRFTSQALNLSETTRYWAAPGLLLGCSWAAWLLLGCLAACGLLLDCSWLLLGCFWAAPGLLLGLLLGCFRV